jgi:hypothetical protein
MTYVVIAAGVARRAGRWEARSVGDVEADSRDETERLAKLRWPGLRLTVVPPAPTLGPSTLCRGPRPDA